MDSLQPGSGEGLTSKLQRHVGHYALPLVALLVVLIIALIVFIVLTIHYRRLYKKAGFMSHYPGAFSNLRVAGPRPNWYYGGANAGGDRNLDTDLYDGYRDSVYFKNTRFDNQPQYAAMEGFGPRGPGAGKAAMTPRGPCGAWDPAALTEAHAAAALNSIEPAANYMFGDRALEQALPNQSAASRPPGALSGRVAARLSSIPSANLYADANTSL